MLPEFLQDRAALYVSGAMSVQEREDFEPVLEFHEELRVLVSELSEVSVAAALATQRPGDKAPSCGLKERIFSQIAGRPQVASTHGLVMAGPDGLVQWINPAFSDMCGYSIEELRGKKLGPILQGEKTDPNAALRMRQAVQAFEPCCETILNYHRNGTPYWVEMAITPILDDSGKLLWLVARERELTDRVAA